MNRFYLILKKLSQMTKSKCILYAFMLTGFSGGLDRMNSSMTSWALFFNLGGMSPLTCSKKKAQHGSKVRQALYNKHMLSVN